MALAENSGLNALKVLTQAKASQIENKSGSFGIDCMSAGETDMKKQKICWKWVWIIWWKA